MRLKWFEKKTYNRYGFVDSHWWILFIFDWRFRVGIETTYWKDSPKRFSIEFSIWPFSVEFGRKWG